MIRSVKAYILHRTKTVKNLHPSTIVHHGNAFRRKNTDQHWNTILGGFKKI